ncbi:MAG TPA: PepSY-like domain-containing protein [Puia sp.]|nr:PepSY-like domain-containing protein [Puia sp.]
MTYLQHSLIMGALALAIAAPSTAQHLKTSDVPATVKTALTKKYPAATGVTWEKEKGNYEANWGGKSKEDNSVVFTPEGGFVEQVVAIPVTGLPAGVADYVKKNYPGAKITEAGKVTDAAGKISFEAEVKGKDLIFDETGKFLKKD